MTDHGTTTGGVCRVCGGTDDGSCGFWIDDEHTLCSSCHGRDPLSSNDPRIAKVAAALWDAHYGRGLSMGYLRVALDALGELELLLAEIDGLRRDLERERVARQLAESRRPPTEDAIGLDESDLRDAAACLAEASTVMDRDAVQTAHAAGLRIEHDSDRTVGVESVLAGLLKRVCESHEVLRRQR